MQFYLYEINFFHYFRYEIRNDKIALEMIVT